MSSVVLKKDDKKTSHNKSKVLRASSSKSSPKKRKNTYDPFLNRPTVEKRERYHPTNFIKTNFKGEIRVVPLGGMEQVGENMMFIETKKDIIIIDTGLIFPSPEHLGVEALIPDISYLVKNKDKIRGVIYTHGHLDHIGGVPYIIPKLGYPPLYATRLTKELILAQCSDHGDLAKKLRISEITPKSKIKLGGLDFEFFHINHSIPDGVGVVCRTPYGAIVHSSDFKFDYNPSDDQPIDLARIGQIGKSGVILAMVDSTNAMKKGHTISESVIEEHLAKIIQEAPGRVVVATFASNIGRISKLIEAAEAQGRTVFISGRSMERNIAIARKLNYLRCKDKTLQRMGPKANTLPGKRVLILSTGSQGEELAALTRMAAGTHKDIKLTPEDTVVFSSSPIPGNELAIVAVKNNLAEIGCRMIDDKDLDIHVSGHGYAEECKLMVSLLNPKYFAPIHGEIFMREHHRQMIIKDLQMRPEHTFLMKNGQGVVLGPKGARLMTEKESVAGPEVMIELGEQVADKVLQDRQKLADSGIVLIHIDTKEGKIRDLQIRSRGFLYMNQEHEIFDTLKKEIQALWERNYDPARPEKVLQAPITQYVQRFFLQKFKKEVITEVFIAS